VIGYEDSAQEAVVVLQSEQYPDERVAEVLAKRCGVDSENLCLVLSPLSSMSGVVQVTGRSVENAMVKLNALNYSVKAVKHACGIAPVPPLRSKILPDDMLSYASVVHLYVLPSDGEDLETVVRRLPSQTSKSYGKSFSTLTREHGGLRGIDLDLFAPAEVYVNNLKTGELYHSGKVNYSLIKAWLNQIG
jgi:methenyltetrahydromethanopterin cyclohydrolase